MTLKYNLFCIPGNIDEVIDRLKEKNTIRANVYVHEIENWSQGIITRESFVSLGDDFLKSKRYIVERRVLNLVGRSNLQIDEEDKNNSAIIKKESAKARDELRKQGIYSDIIYID